MSTEVSAEQIFEEYKKFLNIVSHDLKSPIRHLENFIPMLLEAIGDNLNDEAQECADFINQSLIQLKEMQSSLLTLSRVVTNEETFQTVDSTDLINEALEDLDEPIKNHNPDIQYDNLPAITVAPKQFKNVFKNIIENALTYHKENKEIKITIFAHEENDEITFTIADNGIKIPKEQRENVFNMFRRLHGENEYGNRIGAGLTIAKAIVQRHRGSIWIDNDENTLVKFTVPKDSLIK